MTELKSCLRCEWAHRKIKRLKELVALGPDLYDATYNSLRYSDPAARKESADRADEILGQMIEAARTGHEPT